jgi:hypothetical protein
VIGSPLSLDNKVENDSSIRLVRSAETQRAKSRLTAAFPFYMLGNWEDETYWQSRNAKSCVIPPAVSNKPNA